MGGVTDWLFGTPDKIKQVSTGTKQQEAFHGNLLNQLQQSMGQGGGYSNANNYFNQLLQGGLGNQDAYNQFSQPYMQQFNEQVLPGIAERFGGMGALSSSGFGQALGGAATGLQSQLAQLFSDLQSQAAQQQYGQFNQLGQFGLNYKPFENIKQEGSAGAFAPMMGALGTALAGPLGGLAASGISSLFKPQQQSSGIGGFAPMAAMMGMR